MTIFHHLPSLLDICHQLIELRGLEQYWLEIEGRSLVGQLIGAQLIWVNLLGPINCGSINWSQLIGTNIRFYLGKYHNNNQQLS